jgi:hypothetical protein
MSPVVAVGLSPMGKYQISAALPGMYALTAFVRECGEPSNVKVIAVTILAISLHPVETTRSRPSPEGTEKLGMERLVL